MTPINRPLCGIFERWMQADDKARRLLLDPDEEGATDFYEHLWGCRSCQAQWDDVQDRLLQDRELEERLDRSLEVGACARAASEVQDLLERLDKPGKDLWRAAMDGARAELNKIWTARLLPVLTRIWRRLDATPALLGRVFQELSKAGAVVNVPEQLALTRSARLGRTVGTAPGIHASTLLKRERAMVSCPHCGRPNNVAEPIDIKRMEERVFLANDGRCTSIAYECGGCRLPIVAKLDLWSAEELCERLVSRMPVRHLERMLDALSTLADEQAPEAAPPARTSGRRVTFRCAARGCGRIVEDELDAKQLELSEEQQARRPRAGWPAWVYCSACGARQVVEVPAEASQASGLLTGIPVYGERR